jgi:predicted Zn-ribbon and HTH transcriptional regulator
MSTEALLFGYVMLLLGGLLLLALYTERRQRRFGPRPTDDRIFRCDRCGYVYTDDPDVDRSRCQQCGTLNEAIRF